MRSAFEPDHALGLEGRTTRVRRHDERRRKAIAGQAWQLQEPFERDHPRFHRRQTSDWHAPPAAGPRLDADLAIVR
ncbi:MAG TPA: hypothetical protein VFH80_01120 [Solirubrobacteraceae bacterium]|nr:hypothetical protein [Solirubrobacteraceae bacterium]